MNPQLQLMLQQAIQAFQDGNFDRADSTLKRVLQVDKKNLPALHVLGLIKASQANFIEAADLLGRAARIQPNDASIQYNLAKALSDCGLDRESMPHHKKAVQLAANNPEAWLNYGKSASSLGRYSDALDCFSKALSLNPSFAEAALNKGATLKELQRYEEAIVFAELALEIKPNLIQAWSNKGTALTQLNRYCEAIECYDKVLSLQPDNAEGWSNKGLALYALERYDEAMRCYDKVLSLQPDNAEGWSNKGLTLHALERYDEAITHFDKALILKSEYSQAWFNKGVTLDELKLNEEALAHYDKALSLKSEYGEAWFNKGVTLYGLQHYDEAIECYEKVISLKSDIDWIYGDLLHTKMRICSWTGLEESLGSISKKIIENKRVMQPFSLLGLNDDAFLHKKTSEIYIESKYPFNDALGAILKRPKNQKIRIGYFSANFHNHAVGNLIAELFELHDKTQFELIGFSFGPIVKDGVRQRLEKPFHEFIEVGNKSDIEVAQLSRSLNIDIAVDLSGFTQNLRTGIFSYRAAPIQVSYLGYTGTIGASYFDYIIADTIVIPVQSQHFYSEKIVYLPNSFQVNDRQRPISDRLFTRQELNLPEDGFVFCCFNSNHKILPATFASWMRILKAVEGSVLWLLQDNSRAVENLRKEADQLGVDAKRLVFAERMTLSEHLARHRQADLFLDTLPFNAHTTTSDALWTGLPVLTVMGESFASRVAASLLIGIGLPELITNTQKEYEALAIELAGSPQKLRDVKLKLASNRLTSPLFDTPIFTKNIESAYSKMVERYQADLPPEHISIV
jgi:predicted O-linked N-acetylglucosamine transferase (SPINDLY family)